MKRKMIFKKIKYGVKKVGKFVAGSLLGAALIFGAGKARADSIELMAGHNQTTLDIKAGAKVNDKVNIFGRVRPTVNYEGELSTFGLMDLSINLIGPLDFVAEVQMFGGQVVPRAGLQYFGMFGDFKIYTLMTVGMNENPNLESLTVLAFNPKLNELLGILARLENVTDLGSEGHEFSTQRLRLALTIAKFALGAAADLVELGTAPTLDDGTFIWTAGGFGEVTF